MDAAAHDEWKKRLESDLDWHLKAKADLESTAARLRREGWSLPPQVELYEQRLVDAIGQLEEAIRQLSEKV